MRHLLEWLCSALLGRLASMRQSIASAFVLFSNGIAISQHDTRGSTRQVYQRRFQLTLRQWLLHHQHRVIFKQASWMGAKMLKSPLDAWVYQELLYQIKPDIVIEIGSASGGSTLYLAHMLDIIGNGRVISIDIDRSSYAVSHPRITALTGDSSSPVIVDQVRAICRGKSVFVIHDGDHHKEQVLKDLILYGEFVSVGSYLIVEDGIVDLFKPIEMMWEKRAGPLAAVEEFVKRNSDFQIDLEQERYLLTYNPRGYLRRIS